MKLMQDTHTHTETHTYRQPHTPKLDSLKMK